MKPKKEMEKAYQPNNYEDKIYQEWENSGYFNPDKLKLPKTAKSYTIILPPPNITAQLHLGHASIVAIEDLLVRLHRMKGYRTLYLPGTDHAAIATQNVVEKKILKEEGKTRFDLGREELLKRVWEFLRETQATILKQARKMGGSFDWSREAFTLDEKRQKAVREMFVRMYEAGAIYRGNRMVNWCPRCHSTLADDEIEYRENNTKLYTFKYDASFPISISTTRPETKLGDTAVAVNPKDKRYKKYIGKTYNSVFCGIDLEIKIIADPQIDMNFGTGALGVTPAHSMIDWEMAQKNNLPAIEVINEDGNIKEGFAEYSNKSATEAREMIVQSLQEQGLLEKEEELSNNLSVCYRCGETIEPLLSNQWFVAVDKKIKSMGNKSLKEKAIEVAKKNKILFFPERFTKRYLHWMENLHDWCISRQIWFGHHIPVWYCDECGEITVSREEKITKCPKCKSTSIHQDEDTLDTWFSSGMWTFSTLGWPDTYKNGKKSGDLAKFHPTQVLETGYEIITLWVSRMIMMSLFAVNEIPFKHVYLHGMVLDKFGKKMSKSKGNGIDPLDMIEKYGTDALRLSLLVGGTPGNDMRMSEEKIEGFRNFINKIWNISRFIISQNKKGAKIDPKRLTLADKWILSKTNELIGQVTKDLEKYDFSLAGEKIRNFAWDDFADWYIEISKTEKGKNAVLFYVLENLLKLLHPFTPFVTEEIFSNIKTKKSELLMVAAWPKADKKLIFKKSDLEKFELIKDLVVKIRHNRNAYKIAPDKTLPLTVSTEKTAIAKLIKENQAIIEKLSKTSIAKIEKEIKKPKASAAIVAEEVRAYLDLAGAIDFAKEKQRLEKELKTHEARMSSFEQKMKNKSFVKNAPKEVISIAKENIKKEQSLIKELNSLIKNLE